MPLKTRSTDLPGARPMPPVITDSDSAREAALASVTTWCGWCGAQIPYGKDRHDCRVTDRVKQMHADGARREYEHLSRFVPPPCSVCQRSFPAGTSHDCSYPTTQMPHDIAAARFAAQGAAKQLAAELEELKRTSK